MTKCRTCGEEIEQWIDGSWVDESIADIADPSAAALCEDGWIHRPAVPVNAMLAELADLRNRDEDVKLMIETIIRAENCGLADLPEDQLAILYDECLQLIEQLGADAQ